MRQGVCWQTVSTIPTLYPNLASAINPNSAGQSPAPENHLTHPAIGAKNTTSISPVRLHLVPIRPSPLHPHYPFYFTPHPHRITLLPYLPYRLPPLHFRILSICPRSFRKLRNKGNSSRLNSTLILPLSSGRKTWQSIATPVPTREPQNRTLATRVQTRPEPSPSNPRNTCRKTRALYPGRGRGRGIALRC